jgi:hypothetical protein
MQRVVVLLSAAFLAAGAAQSRPVGIRSMVGLLARSDLVVVGDLTTIEPGPSAGSGFVQILPSKYFKGSGEANFLRIGYEGMSPPFGTNLKGRRVMAFATDDANGGRRLVPMVDSSEIYLDECFLAIDPPLVQPLVAEDAKDTPIRKMIKELATIHASSGSDHSMAGFHLQSLAALGVEPKTLSAVFRAFAHSTARDGLTFGTRGLVALGGLEGLESLDSALASGHTELIEVARHLEQSYKSTDPRGVAILAGWLAAASPAALRPSAAAALARIHTAEAIVVLGPALEDPDFQVRWRAIGGLAMFANNVPLGGGGSPAAGPWPFLSEDTIRFSIYDENGTRKNENHYLDFWRGWWRENSAAVAKFANASGRR